MPWPTLLANRMASSKRFSSSSCTASETAPGWHQDKKNIIKYHQITNSNQLNMLSYVIICYQISSLQQKNLVCQLQLPKKDRHCPLTNIRGSVGVNPRHILQQVAHLAPCQTVSRRLNCPQNVVLWSTDLHRILEGGEKHHSISSISNNYMICAYIYMCVCTIWIEVKLLILQGATGVPGGSVANEDTPPGPV